MGTDDANRNRSQSSLKQKQEILFQVSLVQQRNYRRTFQLRTHYPKDQNQTGTLKSHGIGFLQKRSAQ